MPKQPSITKNTELWRKLGLITLDAGKIAMSLKHTKLNDNREKLVTAVTMISISIEILDQAYDYIKSELDVGKIQEIENDNLSD